MPATVTRFAPSPTGPLHLGHALAAAVAHDLARAAGGRFLLRLDDIDVARCRAEFEAGILADLRWLALGWDGEPLRQSTRLPAYRAALDGLAARGLVYPCFCTRREIAAEVARMPAAPQGPEGPLYPGTCRLLGAAERQARQAAGQVPALRLDVAACQREPGIAGLTFREHGHGPGGEHGIIAVVPAILGDIVLGRRDVGVSYHLACVLDDAYQGVNLVTRGEDLFTATHVQRLLQALLGLPEPGYQHHRLVRDGAGRRLAKRDQDHSLASLRAAGADPEALLTTLRAGGDPRVPGQ